MFFQNHRALAKSNSNKQGKGNPDAARDFANFYGNNFSPQTFTTASGAPPQSDYQLVCGGGDNNDAAAGELEKKLFGANDGLYATCFCEPSMLGVYCSYDVPQCAIDNTYCYQNYFWWGFAATTAEFQSATHCSLCHSGACLTDPTVFNGSCNTISFPNAATNIPSGVCIASFAHEGFAVGTCNLDCRFCQTPQGWWGITPGAAHAAAVCNSWFVTDVSGCAGNPFLYNPFLALRAEQEESSVITAIASSVVGVALFLAIGGGVYYYLYYGRCPWQRNEEPPGNNGAGQQQPVKP